jgi:hypothetical protein
VAVPALPRGSHRDRGKIKKHNIITCPDRPTELVEGLRTLLKGGKVASADQEAVIVRRVLPHGHVTAVLGAKFSLRGELFNEGKIAL